MRRADGAYTLAHRADFIGVNYRSDSLVPYGATEE
jgi:hypothetical protein